MICRIVAAAAQAKLFGHIHVSLSIDFPFVLTNSPERFFISFPRRSAINAPDLAASLRFRPLLEAFLVYIVAASSSTIYKLLVCRVELREADWTVA